MATITSGDIDSLVSRYIYGITDCVKCSQDTLGSIHEGEMALGIVL